MTRESFQRKVQACLADLASRGVVGGPTVQIIGDECRAEISARTEIAVTALKTASLACDIRFTRGLADALVDAFDKLSAPAEVCQN